MDMLSSTIAEDGQAQRLQSKLIESENEMKKKLDEAKAEMDSLHRANIVTKMERDEARAEAA